MKKLTLKVLTAVTMISVIVLSSPQSTAFAPCEDDDLPASLVFFQDDYDHPNNCAYAGNGCTSCTSTPIEE